MAKSIGADIGIAAPKKKVKPSLNTVKMEAGKLVDLNFKVTPEFKKEFKQIALDLDLKQKELLELAIDKVKESLAK